MYPVLIYANITRIAHCSAIIVEISVVHISVFFVHFCSVYYSVGVIVVVMHVC